MPAQPVTTNNIRAWLQLEKKCNLLEKLWPVPAQPATSNKIRAWLKLEQSVTLSIN